MSLTAPFPMKAWVSRVEDTILVTETEWENLTTGIPRDFDEIKALTRVGWISLPEYINSFKIIKNKMDIY